MKRIPITPEIEYLEPGVTGNYSSCAGIIISNGIRALIDTNMGYEHTVDFLREFKPDVAVISHYHLDHATWGSLVLEHTDARLLIPQREEAYISSLDFFVSNTAEDSGLGSTWRDFAQNITRFRNIEGYETYESPSTFPFGKVKIECLATPGHSPAHSSFYFPGQNILFTGDLGIDRFGPWYGWKDCSIPDLIESLLRMKSLDAGLIVTSHGGIISKDISGVWDKALYRIISRERFISECLDEGRTSQEIVEEGIFFRNKAKLAEPMRSFFTMWDSIMFGHHTAVLRETSLCDLFPELRAIEAKENRLRQ